MSRKTTLYVKKIKSNNNSKIQKLNANNVYASYKLKDDNTKMSIYNLRQHWKKYTQFYTIRRK